jgi:hypothetical protein
VNDEKKATIRAYLSSHFPNATIEEKHDFDVGAQAFKLHVSGGTLLLKVGDEFAEDNSASEILRLFNLWSLAEILGKEQELGVLATGRGLETFLRA